MLSSASHMPRSLPLESSDDCYINIMLLCSSCLLFANVFASAFNYKGKTLKRLKNIYESLGFFNIILIKWYDDTKTDG